MGHGVCNKLLRVQICLWETNCHLYRVVSYRQQKYVRFCFKNKFCLPGVYDNLSVKDTDGVADSESGIHPGAAQVTTAHAAPPHGRMLDHAAKLQAVHASVHRPNDATIEGTDATRRHTHSLTDGPGGAYPRLGWRREHGGPLAINGMTMF